MMMTTMGVVVRVLVLMAVMVAVATPAHARELTMGDLKATLVDKTCSEWTKTHTCPPGTITSTKRTADKCEFCDCDQETFNVVVKRKDVRQCHLICCEKPPETCSTAFFNKQNTECVKGFHKDESKAEKPCRSADECKTECCSKDDPPPPGATDCSLFFASTGKCFEGYKFDDAKVKKKVPCGKGAKHSCPTECCYKPPPPPCVPPICPPPVGQLCSTWLGVCDTGYERNQARNMFPCLWGCKDVCCKRVPTPPGAKDCRSFFKEGGTCSIAMPVPNLLAIAAKTSCHGFGCLRVCCMNIPCVPPCIPIPPGRQKCGDKDGFLQDPKQQCHPGFVKDVTTKSVECYGESCRANCCKQGPPGPPEGTCDQFYKTVKNKCTKLPGAVDKKCVGNACYEVCCGKPPATCKEYAALGKGVCDGGKKVPAEKEREPCGGPDDCKKKCCHDPETCTRWFASNKCGPTEEKQLDMGNEECADTKEKNEKACASKCCGDRIIPDGSITCKTFFVSPDGGCKKPTKRITTKEAAACTKGDEGPGGCQKVCCHNTCTSFWMNQKCKEPKPIQVSARADDACETDKCADVCCKPHDPTPGTCETWWMGNRCPPNHHKVKEHKIKKCEPCPGCKPCVPCPPVNVATTSTTKSPQAPSSAKSGGASSSSSSAAAIVAKSRADPMYKCMMDLDADPVKKKWTVREKDAWCVKHVQRLRASASSSSKRRMMFVEEEAEAEEEVRYCGSCPHMRRHHRHHGGRRHDERRHRYRRHTAHYSFIAVARRMFDPPLAASEKEICEQVCCAPGPAPVEPPPPVVPKKQVVPPVVSNKDVVEALHAAPTEDKQPTSTTPSPPQPTTKKPSTASSVDERIARCKRDVEKDQVMRKWSQRQKDAYCVKHVQRVRHTNDDTAAATKPLTHAQAHGGGTSSSIGKRVHDRHAAEKKSSAGLAKATTALKKEPSTKVPSRTRTRSSSAPKSPRAPSGSSPRSPSPRSSSRHTIDKKHPQGAKARKLASHARKDAHSPRSTTARSHSKRYGKL